jgi:hypothetical protein
VASEDVDLKAALHQSWHEVAADVSRRPNSRVERGVVFLVPKLHLGTPLSAQFHSPVPHRSIGIRWNRQWSCLSKCVPKWSLGTR